MHSQREDPFKRLASCVKNSKISFISNNMVFHHHIVGLHSSCKSNCMNSMAHPSPDLQPPLLSLLCPSSLSFHNKEKTIEGGKSTKKDISSNEIMIFIHSEEAQGMGMWLIYVLNTTPTIRLEYIPFLPSNATFPTELSGSNTC